MTSEEAGKSERERSWGSRDLIWVVLVVAIVFVGRFTPFKPVRQFFESFSWLTEQMLGLASDLFESYGYLTVFLAPLLENTIFIGALIPGTIVMLVAGISAADGFINFWLALPLAIAGAIIGDTISYGMGRFGSGRLGPEARLAKFADRMREPLMDQSIWLVLSYHFAGYSRMVGPAAAGFLKMPFLRWMVLDYIGVTAWVIVFMTTGYVLGRLGLSLDDSDASVRVFEIILFAFFVVAVFTVLNRAQARQRVLEGENEAAETPPPTESS